MKIKSFILVFMAIVFVGQIEAKAQQTDRKYIKSERNNDADHRVDRSQRQGDVDHRVHRKQGQHKKQKAKQLRSNRRIAKADGRITRDERRQMKREARSFSARGRTN